MPFAVLSLLACVVTGALWAWSHFSFAVVSRWGENSTEGITTHGYNYHLASAAGRLILSEEAHLYLDRTAWAGRGRGDGVSGA
jgi:hypothetical protein